MMQEERNTIYGEWVEATRRFVGSETALDIARFTLAAENGAGFMPVYRGWLSEDEIARAEAAGFPLIG